MIGGREREAVSDSIHSHMKRERESGVFHPRCCGSSCKEKAGSPGSNIIQREEERGWADGESHHTATEKEGG